MLGDRRREHLRRLEHELESAGRRVARISGGGERLGAALRTIRDVIGWPRRDSVRHVSADAIPGRRVGA